MSQYSTPINRPAFTCVCAELSWFVVNTFIGSKASPDASSTTVAECYSLFSKSDMTNYVWVGDSAMQEDAVSGQRKVCESIEKIEWKWAWLRPTFRGNTQTCMPAFRTEQSLKGQFQPICKPPQKGEPLKARETVHCVAAVTFTSGSKLPLSTWSLNVQCTSEWVRTYSTVCSLHLNLYISHIYMCTYTVSYRKCLTSWSHIEVLRNLTRYVEQP